MKCWQIHNVHEGKQIMIDAEELVVPIIDSLYTSPDGKKIEEKESLRDLGIQLSNNLKFNRF